MGSFIDLTGKRFGKLTVICRDSDKEEPSGRKVPMWKCKCDCGNEKVIRGAFLRNGSTKSCGCLGSEYLHSSENSERARQMGFARRKYIGCLNCDNDKHYAKGYCKKCYTKFHRAGVI